MQGHDSDKVMCERLTCYNPIEMKCVTRVDQRAATGTTCGNKKVVESFNLKAISGNIHIFTHFHIPFQWCNQGKCVSNSQGHAASGDFCFNILNFNSN